MTKIMYDYYILEFHPDHPRAEGEGWVPQHILVMELYLGRSLSLDEDVKHLNGNAHDNRIDNLRLITSHSNSQYHSVLDSQEMGRKLSRTFIPCKFQKECWKTVRAPIAKANNVYLPYVCSWQTEGDLYRCSHFWNFTNREKGNAERIEPE